MDVMKRSRRVWWQFFAWMFFCVGFTSAFAQNDVFRVGIVPQFDATRTLSTWRPILKKLHDETGFEFKLTVSMSIAEFEQELSLGAFDIAYMNPYHIVKYARTSGYIPMVRDGENKLYGILVVKKESPYFSVTELNNKKIAFPSANAVGASLVMRAELLRLHKLRFEPIYVRSHDSVFLNVISGLTDAGGAVQSTFDAQPNEVKDRLRTIYTTKTFNPHPIAAHPRVSTEVREKLIAAILRLSKSENGSQMFEKIPMRTSIRAEMADYDDVRAMRLDEIAE